MDRPGLRPGRRQLSDGPNNDGLDNDGPDRCWLCDRPLGRRVEWHHPLPRSRGGRQVVPLHPICHRTIHATLTNADLARAYADAPALRVQPAIARFLAWVADKPADFHAPTRQAPTRRRR